MLELSVDRLNRAAEQVLAEVRKPFRISLERWRRRLERAPSVDRLEWQRTFERVGERLLLPIMRRLYAHFGAELAEQLRRWHERIAFAITESDLPADIGYFHMLHLQSVWRRFSARLVQQVVERVLYGLQHGETQEQTMEGIDAILQLAVGYQLERIVRTETTRYYNYAIVYETGAYPEVVGYRYEVVVDDRTSDICRPLAGKVVPIDQLKLVPPLHPNCRTILVPMLERDMARHEVIQEQEVPLRAWAFGLIPTYLKERIATQGARPTPSQQFWQVWQQHEPSIRKLCFHLVGGDEARGADLCSASMLRAYERYHLYDARKSAFPTWVYNIAKAMMLNELEKGKREWLTAQFDGAEFDD